MTEYCSKCSKELDRHSWKIRRYNPESMTRYGIGNRLCKNCFSELRDEWLEKNPPVQQRVSLTDSEKKFRFKLILQYVLLHFICIAIFLILFLRIDYDYLQQQSTYLLFIGLFISVLLINFYFYYRFYKSGNPALEFFKTVPMKRNVLRAGFFILLIFPIIFGLLFLYLMSIVNLVLNDILYFKEAYWTYGNILVYLLGLLISSTLFCFFSYLEIILIKKMKSLEF